MKFVTFVAAPEGADAAAFRAWIGHDYAPGFARGAHGLRGCLVRTPYALPADLPAEVRRDPDPSFPRCDAVIESWFSTTEAYREAWRSCEAALRDRAGLFMSYRCTPWLEKDPRVAEAGANGKRPELTLTTPVRWRPGSDSRRHWDEHVPIALRVHRGLSKYERNWVDEVMAISPGVVPVDGFADFSFPTLASFLDEFYPTAADRREIQHDIADFIASGWSIHLTDAAAVAAA